MLTFETHLPKANNFNIAGYKFYDTKHPDGKASQKKFAKLTFCGSRPISPKGRCPLSAISSGSLFVISTGQRIYCPTNRSN